MELTVTPPGLVVPVTNHCAVAPFLNPLPETMTLRFVVPWDCVVRVGAVHLDLGGGVLCSQCGKADEYQTSQENVADFLMSSLPRR